ncbi:MAG: hypothetical protein IPJ71_11585 [Bdellovibrionales bacterium]|nr:hypothetical protein [Bdellovibrionales bacterium]
MAQDGARLLSSPSHPRSEVDLAIYLLPFLAHKEATAALETCLSNLKSRRNFLEERCKWCKTQELQLPLLAFERPLRLLEVEIAWLREVLSELRKNKKEFNIEGWRKYEYREPTG